MFLAKCGMEGPFGQGGLGVGRQLWSPAGRAEEGQARDSKGQPSNFSLDAVPTLRKSSSGCHCTQCFAVSQTRLGFEVRASLARKGGVLESGECLGGRFRRQIPRVLFTEDLEVREEVGT